MRSEDRDDHETGGGDGGDEPDWSPAERALLDSALDFFGAAEAVIDYAGPDRPHLRYDVAGLQEVRSAMAALEARIHVAHVAGVTPERIAGITRLEQEIVELIVARHREPAPDPTPGPQRESPEPA